MRGMLAIGTVLLAGCVTVGIGSDSGVQTQYVLNDQTTSAQRRSAPVAPALLIVSEAGDPIADSLSIAYARRSGERALYQLATWADRPSRRLAQLVQQRLLARGSVAAVAMLGQPLNSDWLLNLSVTDIHHDVSNEPGQARLALRATLFDRRQRTLLGQQAFEASVPAAAATSAAAAAAMNQAVARALDALVPWLEQQLELATTTAKRS